MRGLSEGQKAAIGDRLMEEFGLSRAEVAAMLHVFDRNMWTAIVAEATITIERDGRHEWQVTLRGGGSAPIPLGRSVVLIPLDP